jgi:hypothetical protein
MKAGLAELLVLKSCAESPLALLWSELGLVDPFAVPLTTGLTDMPASELVNREAAMSSRRFRILELASLSLS